MISRPKSRAVEELKVYRCPACGELVDNTDWDAIRLHHDHVLHPRQDVFVSLSRPVGSPEDASAHSSAMHPPLGRRSDSFAETRHHGEKIIIKQRQNIHA
jgi:hypothetical protein